MIRIDHQPESHDLAIQRWLHWLMKQSPRSLLPAYWSATLMLLGGAILLAAFYAPIDPVMGPVQKILYIHLPAAINMFVGCGIVCIASVGYLWQRRPEWDDIAMAAGEVTVLLCTFVLVTGMIWAHSAWGVWWAWSPRLSFSLIIWLLYVTYLILQRVVSPDRRRAVCAFYAIIASLNVPLFYLSIRLLDDIHPSESSLPPAMRETLFVWFVPVTLICAGVTYARLARPKAATPSPLPR